MVPAPMVITGPTSGIGRAAAGRLAANGRPLVLACRDTTRGDALAGTLGGQVEVVAMDLADLASVRDAAATIAARHDALGGLLNNAGVHLARRETTTDGFERTFQVNHLGPFLLTRELLPLLRHGRGTVVNVASDAHHYARLDLRTVARPRRYSGLVQYCNTKLLNVLHALHLDALEEAVTAHAAHPGIVRSGWARDRGSGIFRFGVALASPFALTPEEGARTPLTALAAGGPGRYWVKGRPRRPSTAAQRRELQAAAWEHAEGLLAGDA